MKNKYNDLMNFTAESIIIIDRNGFIVDFNYRAEKMLGYKRRDLKKMHTKDLFATDIDYFTELCLDRTDAHSPCILEKTLLRKDKKTVEVEISTKKFEDETAIFIYDVTERKKNIDYLKNIVWMQCHEVRPPLANILAIVNLIDLKESADFNSTLLQYLKSSAHTLDNAIRKIVNKSFSIYRD